MKSKSARRWDLVVQRRAYEGVDEGVAATAPVVATGDEARTFPLFQCVEDRLGVDVHDARQHVAVKVATNNRGRGQHLVRRGLEAG